MNKTKNIKALYITNSDIEIRDYIKQNSIVLQYYGPVVSPFDEIMRDIIVTIYRYNIKEVVVITPKEESQKNIWALLSKVIEEVDSQEKVQTLNYLFENCKPEFSGNSLGEWLEGGNGISVSPENTVSAIRQHPLMPSDVKIHELIIDNENKTIL